MPLTIEESRDLRHFENECVAQIQLAAQRCRRLVLHLKLKFGPVDGVWDLQRLSAQQRDLRIRDIVCGNKMVE